jgi:peptidyl-Lys metalloendopeptidase
MLQNGCDFSPAAQIFPIKLYWNAAIRDHRLMSWLCNISHKFETCPGCPLSRRRASIGPRYDLWFGVTDSARVSTIETHYVALKDAFANKPLTVDCACTKTYYAYVYPAKPNVIYVCKAFWAAPMTGTDSKGGTLMHEMSHFNVVAGTDDWVYGQCAASLAIGDPAKAIDNADSHEYVGENTPPLQ